MMCNSATVPGVAKTAQPQDVSPADDPNLSVEIGERIGALADAAKLTHKQLGRKIGKDRSYVTRIINGKRKGAANVKLLAAFAEALGVEMGALLPAAAQPTDLPETSDRRGSLPPKDNAGAYYVKTEEAKYIAMRLDAIADDDTRASAMEACSRALREAANPSEQDAGKRPGRVLRK